VTKDSFVASASVPASAWQDIATAPKDGTEVLITGFIWNDPVQGRWQQVAAWNGYEWATEQAPLHPPTHWKPLDAPPEGSGRTLADAPPTPPEPV